MLNKQPNYLNTADLMSRWKCKYQCANAFMHRKGSGAFRIGRKLLVCEKEVQAYERANLVRTG